MIGGVSFRQFLRDLRREAGDDNVFNGAAALAFYLTLAIFPALILLMSLVPYLPIDRVDQAIMDLLGQALPPEAFQLIEKVVNEVTRQRRGDLLSFGALGTAWAASTGMYSIMQQLNITYDIKEGRSFIRARATALVLSLLFIVLVLGAFSLIVLGGMLQDWIGARFGFNDALLAFFAAFRWLVIVLALLLGFAIIYRYGPNTRQRFALITAGSAFGVTLLILASLGFAFYTSNFGDYSSTYGSIGAVIVLMLWLYITGMVILLGAEINALRESYSAK